MLEALTHIAQPTLITFGALLLLVRHLHNFIKFDLAQREELSGELLSRRPK